MFAAVAVEFAKWFLIIGLVIGFFLSLIGYALTGFIDSNNDLIEQCEAELPRNQKCILVAVPDSNGGKRE